MRYACTDEPFIVGLSTSYFVINPFSCRYARWHFVKKVIRILHRNELIVYSQVYSGRYINIWAMILLILYLAR